MSKKNKISFIDLFEEYIVLIALSEIIRNHLKPFVKQYEQNANHISLSISVGYTSKVTVGKPRIYEIRTLKELKEMKKQVIEDSKIYGLPTHITYFIIDDENYVMSNSPHVIIFNYYRAIVIVGLAIITFLIMFLGLAYGIKEIIEHIVFKDYIWRRL